MLNKTTNFLFRLNSDFPFRCKFLETGNYPFFKACRETQSRFFFTFILVWASYRFAGIKFHCNIRISKQILLYFALVYPCRNFKLHWHCITFFFCFKVNIKKKVTRSVNTSCDSLNCIIHFWSNLNFKTLRLNRIKMKIILKTKKKIDPV